MNTPVSPFPLIDIAGPPRQRGMQYGRKARTYIERSLAVYRPAYAAAGLEWPEVRRIAGEFLSRIERFSPAMCEEIAGIAAGCDVPVGDIVALNARTELLYGHGSAASVLDKTEEGCTGAIALPDITQGGQLIHGQNWDWRDECATSTIVLRIRPESGPSILTMVEAGTLARCGFNSEGVAITGNFLKSAADSGRDGVPVPLVRRWALESENLCDAMTRILTAPRSHSNNVMLSQESEAIDLETTPDEVFWVKPQSGLLVHSNHFVAPGALAKVVDTGLKITPDSLYRDSRVRSRLERSAGAVSIRDFKEAFADTFGSPHAVCRLPTSGPGQGSVSTVATIIMNVSARKLWIAPTPYASRHFYQYDFVGEAPCLTEL